MTDTRRVARIPALIVALWAAAPALLGGCELLVPLDGYAGDPTVIGNDSGSAGAGLRDAFSPDGPRHVDGEAGGVATPATDARPSSVTDAGALREAASVASDDGPHPSSTSRAPEGGAAAIEDASTSAIADVVTASVSDGANVGALSDALLPDSGLCPEVPCGATQVCCAATGTKCCPVVSCGAYKWTCQTSCQPLATTSATEASAAAEAHLFICTSGPDVFE